jgi:hypothetical protein
MSKKVIYKVSISRIVREVATFYVEVSSRSTATSRSRKNSTCAMGTTSPPSLWKRRSTS